MLVYVLNKSGRPLMPCKPRRARLLLKDKKAKVVKKEPFTIQLLYGSSGYVQDITLGVDAGSKTIGISAVTGKKEVYAAETELRQDIPELLSSRREARRTRRNHLRYRKPRFDNRTSRKKKGWLAPSIEHKLSCHIAAVENVHKLLPVKKIIVETASFDIQKIKNPDISGTDYQEGEQLGFWNVREYVLWRDNHTCQCCRGKTKDPVLNVHHKESRKTGGDSPDNLITLCETCHRKYHRGEIALPAKLQKRGPSYRDAAFMGIMRWAFYNRLKELYPDVSMTYGYITKNTRIRAGLEKGHAVDARCITANPNAEPLGYYFSQKKMRRHNRKIHKSNLLKGGIRKNNQAAYMVKGFRLYDKVEYENEVCFVYGRRSTGYFDLRKLDGAVVHRSASCKKIKFIEPAKGYITERRNAG